jgi:hypothetical protein
MLTTYVFDKRFLLNGLQNPRVECNLLLVDSMASFGWTIHNPEGDDLPEHVGCWVLGGMMR